MLRKLAQPGRACHDGYRRIDAALPTARRPKSTESKGVRSVGLQRLNDRNAFLGERPNSSPHIHAHVEDFVVEQT